jgi:hypothetical protein
MEEYLGKDRKRILRKTTHYSEMAADSDGGEEGMEGHM